MGALLWGASNAGVIVVAVHLHLHHGPAHDHGPVLEAALHGHAHAVGAEDHDHRLGTTPSATRASLTRCEVRLPAATSHGDRGLQLARPPEAPGETRLVQPPPPFLLHAALLI